MTPPDDDLVDRRVRAATTRMQAKKAHRRAERMRGWLDALVLLAAGGGAAAGLDLLAEATALHARS